VALKCRKLKEEFDVIKTSAVAQPLRRSAKSAQSFKGPKDYQAMRIGSLLLRGSFLSLHLSIEAIASLGQKH
jgi:hypothetical protein